MTNHKQLGIPQTFSRNAKFILATALLSGFMLQGCATYVPPPPAPKFTWGQSVDFEGFSFNFTSATTASSFRNWVNQETRAGDSFVIVEVNMVNKSGAPLPMHLQPIFSLIDASGTVYEPNVQDTIMINMGKSGRLSPGMNMNPNVKTKQEIVFEVPRLTTGYAIRCIVPTRARVGFAGSITSYGPYFSMDISSRL
jgi:hypothetical protein